MLDVDLDKGSPEPLYKQIAGKLREHIVAGNLRDGDKLPPEPELAEMFGANRLTVRKGLKRLELQRLIVQQKGRGTFVTFQQTCHYKIGVSCGHSPSTDLFYMKMVVGLTSAFQEDVSAELVMLDSDQDLLKAAHERRCDGLIVVGANEEMATTLAAPSFSAMPLVVINSADEQLLAAERHCVSIDPTGIGDAVDHLVGLGHRRIAYFTTNAYAPDLTMRNRDFRQAVNDHGLEETATYHELTDRWYDAAAKQARELSRAANPPTAVICAGRTFAYGAWQGLLEAGREIPREVSVIGYDCESSVNPHLSTLSVDNVKMAELAGRVMLGLLEGRTSPRQHYRFAATLVDRGSCAPPVGGVA